MNHVCRPPWEEVRDRERALDRLPADTAGPPEGRRSAPQQQGPGVASMVYFFGAARCFLFWLRNSFIESLAVVSTGDSFGGLATGPVDCWPPSHPASIGPQTMATPI